MEKRSIIKHVLAIGSCFIAIVASPAFAQVEEEAPILDVPAVVSAIHDSTAQKASTFQAQMDKLGTQLDASVEDIKKFIITSDQLQLDAQKAPMPFYEMLGGLTAERVFSKVGAAEVKKQLDDIRRQALAGHPIVENATQRAQGANGATPNPMSQSTTIAMDAIIADKMNTVFCIPESALATADCAAKRNQAGLRPDDNFVDMFISNGTWPSKTILDAMLMTRRFFSTAVTRVELSTDASNPITFMRNQQLLTQDNLRLAVLDSLAARRAPSSNATYSALKTLLMILAPSNQVTSLDYRRICANAQANPVEKYVCTLTGDTVTGAANSERIISQAALDRITQYDLMLSPMFFNQINSDGFTATGPMTKMKVFLKATQLSQDYQALRLLQKITLLKAMNMMNS